MALVVPNKLDHYVKDQRKFKHYIRYMDDFIIFADSKDKLKDIKIKTEEIVNGFLKLNLNHGMKC